ncbi:sirohydrochlorin chelatase [Neobacillus fumarioli]|uniref:sirohydrochlorin chelatase n=1 Tax=Neobacillus fumarioli TaxID=105229 RepID=UPI000835CF2B|nr:sirohydrochlorin chelatase [Neobacillus fumarioli]
MKAILYIGHGTRYKKGAEEVKSFIIRVMDQIDVPIQEISFLELTSPSIEEGFRRCIERGADEITVVPLFLLAAGHIKEDIPNVLSSLKEKYPQVQLNVRDPFGVQEQILDGVAEMIMETAADFSARDSILIVGRGSSDQEIHKAFAEITSGIKKRTGVKHVSVCYLAAAEPNLKEGLQSICEQAARRIIVVPYLLFPGLLLNELNHSLRVLQNKGLPIMHTGPLSRHRVIEEIIIRRATQG